jgi:hypothetical protein
MRRPGRRWAFLLLSTLDGLSDQVGDPSGFGGDAALRLFRPGRSEGKRGHAAPLGKPPQRLQGRDMGGAVAAVAAAAALLRHSHFALAAQASIAQAAADRAYLCDGEAGRVIDEKRSLPEPSGRPGEATPVVIAQASSPDPLKVCAHLSGKEAPGQRAGRDRSQREENCARRMEAVSCGCAGAQEPEALQKGATAGVSVPGRRPPPNGASNASNRRTLGRAEQFRPRHGRCLGS